MLCFLKKQFCNYPKTCVYSTMQLFLFLCLDNFGTKEKDEIMRETKMRERKTKIEKMRKGNNEV